MMLAEMMSVCDEFAYYQDRIARERYRKQARDVPYAARAND